MIRNKLRLSKAVVALSFWAGAGAFAATACGGTMDPEQPTATPSAGQPSAVCVEGDTRECVGPRACQGGQRCESEGWSACDCGDVPSGGGTGSGGAGGSESTGGAYGGQSHAGAGGYGDAGAGGEGNSIWEDDPCIDGVDGCASIACPHVVDDSGFAIADVCWRSTSVCTTSDSTLSIRDEESYAVLRMPRASEIAEGCECGTGTPLYAKFHLVAVKREGTELPPRGHFEVRPPWHFGLFDSTETCAPSRPLQCVTELEWLWTESPDAPEVNVFYAPGPCPE